MAVECYSGCPACCHTCLLPADLLVKLVLGASVAGKRVTIFRGPLTDTYFVADGAKEAAPAQLTGAAGMGFGFLHTHAASLCRCFTITAIQSGTLGTRHPLLHNS